MNPLVSIVIPCYNNRQYVRTTVQSALNQDYDNFEVILVNDGSTEDIKSVIWDLVENYGVKYYEKANGGGGAASARNYGIRMSQGKYIYPLDNDDIIMEDTISSLMEMNGDDENTIVSPWLTYFGNDWPEVWKPSPPTSDIINRNNTPNSSLYSKRLWSIIGGYDEKMTKGYEDWEFWIRMFKQGANFKVCPKHLFLYRRDNRVNRVTTSQNQNHHELVNYIHNKHRS